MEASTAAQPGGAREAGPAEEAGRAGEAGRVVIVVYVPVAAAERVRTALAAAGAGAIGDYRDCSWSTRGTGRFTPVEGASPAIGRIGRPEEVAEERIEVIVPLAAARGALAAMVAAHPYEEPAHHVVQVLDPAELP